MENMNLRKLENNYIHKPLVVMLQIMCLHPPSSFYYETSACSSGLQIQNYPILILPGYVWDFYVLHLIRKLLIVNMVINHVK